MILKCQEHKQEPPKVNAAFWISSIMGILIIHFYIRQRITSVLTTKIQSAIHYRVKPKKIQRGSNLVHSVSSRQCYFQQINLIGSTIARGSICVHLDVPLRA